MKVKQDFIPEGAVSVPTLMAFSSMMKTTLKKHLCKWGIQNSIVKAKECSEVGDILLATPVTECLSGLNPYREQSTKFICPEL